MTISPTEFVIPAFTQLLPGQVEMIQRSLPSWAAGAVVPEKIEWRQSRTMPGVAHGAALFSDPRTGSVAIPSLWPPAPLTRSIFMSR